MNIEIGKHAKHLRERTGLTQRAAAKRLDGLTYDQQKMVRIIHVCVSVAAANDLAAKFRHMNEEKEQHS